MLWNYKKILNRVLNRPFSFFHFFFFKVERITRVSLFKSWKFPKQFYFSSFSKKSGIFKKMKSKKKKNLRPRRKKRWLKFWKTYTSMWVDVSIRSSWRVKRGRRVSCVNLQDPRKGPPFFKRRRHWRIVSTYLETICYSLYTGPGVIFS